MDDDPPVGCQNNGVESSGRVPAGRQSATEEEEEEAADADATQLCRDILNNCFANAFFDSAAADANLNPVIAVASDDAIVAADTVSEDGWAARTEGASEEEVVVGAAVLLRPLQEPALIGAADASEGDDVPSTDAETSSSGTNGEAADDVCQQNGGDAMVTSDDDGSATAVACSEASDDRDAPEVSVRPLVGEETPLESVSRGSAVEAAATSAEVDGVDDADRGTSSREAPPVSDEVGSVDGEDCVSEVLGTDRVSGDSRAAPVDEAVGDCGEAATMVAVPECSSASEDGRSASLIGETDCAAAVQGEGSGAELEADAVAAPLLPEKRGPADNGSDGIYDVPRSLRPPSLSATEDDDADSDGVYDLPAAEADEDLGSDSEATENVYEVIRRRGSGAGPPTRGGAASDESLFKRCSLVDEVLDEVERVQQRHVQVLQELNLDVENLIMPPPTTPSVSPNDSSCANVGGGRPCTPPCVPPHALLQPSWSVPSGGARKMSTRTLPPLPTEAVDEQTCPRKAGTTRDTERSRTASTALDTTYGHPEAPPPSGVKHWLSRLTSLSSFREKKSLSRSSSRLSWRWSLGHAESSPIYMLYDDSYRLHAGNKCSSDDGIYEDIDRHSTSSPSAGVYASFTKAPVADRTSLYSAEFADDFSDTESVRSVGNLSVSSLKGKILNFGRKLATRHGDDRMKDAGKTRASENEAKSEGGKLSKIFGRRKGYDVGRFQDGSVISEDCLEDDRVPQLRMASHHLPSILPPPPSGLTDGQTKRRHIIATLVHSEASYIASLKRLVQDYKKPLEESVPPVINAHKTATLFHRVPEVLQIHVNFGISLGICVRNWDKEEKIGQVFINTFSKSSVLDVYSDYINNFSASMELAKQEAKRKSAFTDFLKVKQITSHDRLSFFGLMVKPVQRFPQFILLLQDLLRHTPPGHHDRLALQLALTQMEMLTEMLNDSKRESDQAQAVKAILRHVSAKSAARSLSEGTRFLLHQDTLTQLIFNQNGQWTKSKERCLFLLNDLLVCVSVSSSVSDGRTKSERYSLKWAVPVCDVEVQEDASPILNRMVHAMATGQSSATKGGADEIEGVQLLYQDLNDLIHDFEILGRITSLVSSLRRHHKELSIDVVQRVSQSVQKAIQQKDEEVKWIDSCCLQLTIPLKSKTGKVQRQLVIFQTRSMDTKQDWLTDVRLAQLALDTKNATAWDFPEQERRPSTRIPLFVKSVLVVSESVFTEVKCGCYHMTMSSRLSLRPQNYVWLCSSDGFNCHISIHTLRQMGLKEVFSFDLTECRISAIESVPGLDSPTAAVGLGGDTVWMGTESRRVIVYCGTGSENFQEVGSASLSAPALHIRHHLQQVYVALANGTLAVFSRSEGDMWEMKGFRVVTLGSDPVTCLLPVNAFMYCGCGRQVSVLDSEAAKIVHVHSVHHEHLGNIYTMAHSGIGLWLNLRNTPLVCLYHAETFQHLQDINVTSSVKRIVTDENRPRGPRNIYVTVLCASRGLLWVGTNVGVVLSIPLPRLQGLPMLGRRANMAYHAHVGPVSMVLVLHSSSGPSASLSERSQKDDATAAAKKRCSDGTLVGGQTPPHVYGQLATSPVRAFSRGDHLGIAKTLPRSWKPPPTGSMNESEYEVYGLYGNLLNVKDCDDPMTPMEEDLRHSDPELVPSLVCTLDRRLRMKSGRPRSLDLANLSGLDPVCMSSSSEDGSSAAHSLAEIPECGASRPQSVVEEQEDRPTDAKAGGGGSLDEKQPPATTAPPPPPAKGPPQAAKRSILTLVGGRGYVDLRRPAATKDKVSVSGNSNDAYVILWEMKA